MTLLAAAAAGLAMIWLGSSDAPARVEFANAEPARITDDSGERMSLVTLRVRNCSSALIVFERNKVIEVRVADRWVLVPQAFYLEDMAPGASAELLFLVPARATACRLPLKYQAEALRWRLWRHVPGKVREGIVKSPTLRKWLSPGGNRMPDPPVWRQTRLEANLPEASRFPGTSGF